MLVEDTLPFTVLVPESAAQPIEVYDQHAALRMAIVDRRGAHLIGAEWNAPGVYVLLDPALVDGAWGVYVGKAPTGMATRLKQHLKSKDHWTRALLIRRDTSFGLTSAQIGWLEGRLYDLFEAAEDAQLSNDKRPGDATLPPYDRQMLEAVILPTTRLLRLLGYDPATSDDGIPLARQRSSKFHGITVLDLLAAGLLDAGTQVVSTNGVWPATGTVLADGGIETGDQNFASPSSAASSIKGGEANGWDFWAVETPTGKVTLATLRARYQEGLTQQMAPPE